MAAGGGGAHCEKIQIVIWIRKTRKRKPFGTQDTKTFWIQRYENLLDENPKETYKNLSELKDTET